MENYWLRINNKVGNTHTPLLCCNVNTAPKFVAVISKALAMKIEIQNFAKYYFPDLEPILKYIQIHFS